MKKLILATAAVVVMAGGSATAADMPVKGPILQQPSCAAKKFDGGYIGIHGGTAKHTANRTDRDEFLVDASTYVQRDWGFLVGGHLGWNFTTCSTLFGIEVDGSWVDVDQTLRLINFPGVDITLRSRLDAIATARVRTGIALDNILLYVTGGFAALHTRTDWHTAFPPFFNETLGRKDWDWGWVAGFGSEWAWSERISLRSEVLYIESIDQTYARFSSLAATNFNFTNSDSIWVGRVGLNVKFGPWGY